MRQLRCAVVLLLAGFFLFPASGHAQEGAEEDDPVRVVLLDGSTLIGTVVSEDDERIIFRTVGGVESTIPRGQIRRLETLPGRIVDGRYVRFDPNRTRLLFTPTARPLRQGRGYVAVYQVFFPFVSYGMTSTVSLAGGITLFPAAPLSLLYVAPKVTLVRQEGIDVAVGAFVGNLGARLLDEDTNALFGVMYGLTTLGSEERAVTLGVGFGFADGEVAATPALVLGGELQVSNSIKLLTENYILTSEPQEPLLSGGIRFFGDRLAADFGLFTTPSLLDEGGFPFFPWLGFAYNFD